MHSGVHSQKVEGHVLGVFVVTAREAVELFLILYYVVECLRRAGDARPLPLLLTGTAAGVVLGVAAAGWLEAEPGPAWGSALLSALVAIAIIVLASGGLETIAKIRRSIDARFDGLPLRAAQALALTMAVLAGLREAFECWAQVRMLSRTIAADEMAISVIAALGLTACLAWAGPRLHQAVGARMLFRASAVLLMLLAADMLVDALGVLTALALDASDLGLRLAVTPQGDPAAGMTGVGALARAALMAGLLVLAIQRWWRESR